MSPSRSDDVTVDPLRPADHADAAGTGARTRSRSHGDIVPERSDEGVTLVTTAF